jgi:hypothetical protein
MAEDEIDVGLGDIIAAALDSNYSLTDEQMALLEEAFDHPEMSPESRKEIITTVYTMIVGLIDHCFEYGSLNPRRKTCGQKPKNKASRHAKAPNMLYSKDKKLTKTYKKASTQREAEGGNI